MVKGVSYQGMVEEWLLRQTSFVDAAENGLFEVSAFVRVPRMSSRSLGLSELEKMISELLYE